MSYPVYFINAFAEGFYKGNTAAVVVVSEYPTQEKLLALAKEFGFSETVFLKRIDNNRYQIRWFTPEVEVALCGHGTLAAAKALFTDVLIKDNIIYFDSLSGELKARKQGYEIQLNFPVDKPLATVPDKEILSDLSPYLPVEVLIAPITKNLIVVYSDAKQILTMSPDFKRIVSRPSERYFGIAVTAPSENLSDDYICRYFAPWEGINEDPVTGSAQTYLAPYWSNRLKKSTLKGYQASIRGGHFKVELIDARVLISGKAFIYLRGEIDEGWFK